MGDLRHTIRKLDIVRTLQARRYGARTTELTGLYATTARTIQRDLSERLNQTILQQHRCTVTYRSLESSPKTYPIEPLRLLYYMEAGGLYLVARVPGYQQPITLALERIQQLQPSDQRFAIRTDMAATVDERLHPSFGIIAGEPFQVQIR